MSAPDPLRAKYREHLIAAVQAVLREGHTIEQSVEAAGVSPIDQEPFQAMLQTELAQLEAFNCARHRLPIEKTIQWIANGRPK